MDHPEPRLQIERMTADTVEQVEELERECFQNPWSLDSLVEELSNPLAVFYTASLQDKVVGYVGMHHIIDQGFITNIAVQESHRGQGIARVLMEELLTYGKENELAQITLEVRRSSTPAIRLYESLGFEEAGMRKNFYKNPTEDAWLMTKEF